MKNVYILSKEGKAFSDEGCDLIRNMIKSRFKDSSDLIFSMGDDYNNPVRLKSELTKNPDSYIAISNRHGDAKSVMIIYGENVAATVELLNKNANRRCWDVITEELKKLDTEV